MRCWYEWASHVDRGQVSGLSLPEIKRVLEGPGASGWNERDASLLSAVDELIGNHGMTAKTQKKLATFFTPNQVMDVISIQGMYVTLGCMINTWGLELDTDVEARLPAGISRSEFEAAVDASA